MDFVNPNVKNCRNDLIGRYGLADSDEALQAFIDALPAMVWLGDDKGRVLYFSEQFYAFTGLRREDCLLYTSIPCRAKS